MKKNIILSFILLICILLLIVLTPIAVRTIKVHACSDDCVDSILKFQQNNEETVFSIDKITYFSSCNAKGDTNSNSSFSISDLYQYTDIAIFLNSVSEPLTKKNTLKSVTISDISYEITPSIGEQALYYKSLSDFAKAQFSEDNIITESITFETTSDSSIDYSKPVLYNNCANPITLCYINSKLKDKYTFSNDISNLTYNGSLLKMCGITLSSLNCQIGITITITNNLDEIYSCPLILNIPLSSEANTIYDGNLTMKDSVNYKFIRTN